MYLRSKSSDIVIYVGAMNDVDVVVSSAVASTFLLLFLLLLLLQPQAPYSCHVFSNFLVLRLKAVGTQPSREKHLLVFQQ